MSDWGGAATSPRDVPGFQKPLFSGRSLKIKDQPRSCLAVVEKIPVHYSAEEQYRHYGRIEGPICADLLGFEAQVEALDGIEAHLQEAKGQYPAEDFLTDIASRLTALAKNLRGENRDTLKEISDELSSLAQSTWQAAEYGRSELTAAQKLLGVDV